MGNMEPESARPGRQITAIFIRLHVDLETDGPAMAAAAHAGLLAIQRAARRWQVLSSTARGDPARSACCCA